MLTWHNRSGCVISKSNCLQVSDWNEVKKLEVNGKLSTVYFERNPIERSADYRRKMKLTLPNLTQIDATLCR